MIRRPDFHILGDMLQSNRQLYTTSGVKSLLDTPAAELLQQVSRANLRRDMPADIPYGSAECPCGCGHYLPVERDATNKRYFVVCGESYEEYSVPESDHYMWRINMPVLIEFLHSTFKCRDKCIEMIPGRLWRLGQATETLAGTNRIIFFAQKLDLDVDAMLPKEQTHSILILGENFSTRQMLWGDRVLSLCDILTISGKKLGIDFSRIENAVGPLIPAEKPEKKKRDSGSLAHCANLKKLLREHVKTVKEVYDRTERHISAPTLQYLAGRMLADFNDKVSTSTLSRIFNEQCKPNGLNPDEDLIHLWYLCKNPDKITAYSADHNRPDEDEVLEDIFSEAEIPQTNGMSIRKSAW